MDLQRNKKLIQFDKLIQLTESVTDDRFGYYPYYRPIPILFDYGLVLIDKPSGPTSHEVASWVKRILNIEKSGHSGTLDPGATGLLPMGLGESTKALSVLLLGPKEYYSIARFHSNFDRDILEKILLEFHGDIYQRPPQRSSVKRMTRIRRIHEIEYVEENKNLILLRILCQAGTYIRKLIYDIGEIMGSGATMVELRRTRVSHFFERDGLIKLHDLYNAFYLYKKKNDEENLRNVIKPIETCFKEIPTVVIRDTAVDALCHGAQLAIPGISEISPSIQKDDLVAIYTLKGEIVGLAQSLMNINEIVSNKNGIAFTMKRLIMKPNTYPKGWR
ncbi:MAG TPA: RNA-guided pseudouridylation complex pseudouridine synthase subunit Cbf5 [Nitrososphaeraceae archaeon]|jgi:H/ACA ribonucleoprotein complex subunit 4|nr:RNA-guided pseudouridylation complex pseudouridine synthase subunit Cbf5 [Nitrososphaeraceae archaeon]